MSEHDASKLRAETLEYHQREPAGKISVTATKPCRTQRDLSLAYTPGVAIPGLEIEKDPGLAYQYTAKGNLVAVVTNGTAVLGLGNMGAAASKPVMEGKGVLFKRFAGIDVFDLELATEDPQEIIRTCQLLEPTFGGIAPHHAHSGVPRRPARHGDYLRGGAAQRAGTGWQTD